MAVTINFSDIEHEPAGAFSEEPVDMTYVDVPDTTFAGGYFLDEPSGLWNLVYDDGYSWKEFATEAECVLWIVKNAATLAARN